MDALSESGASVGKVLKAISKNPQILATAAGLGIGISGLDLPEGVYVFTAFAGSTAAPCALFALGVILSRQIDEPALMLPLVISGLKLIAYPLLCWGLLLGLLEIEPSWAKPTMMVAAAPSSAMAFVLALNYKIPTKAIAQIIMTTMIGALLTVTYISGF
jgi:predicted permease